MFQLNLMLADYARVTNGKVDALGAGWSTITAGAPFAIFGKVDVPWDLRTRRHTLRLELVDTDGRPFLLPGGEERPVAFQNVYAPSADAGWGHVKPGSPIDWPFALNCIGLPIAPGTRYEWRLSIDGYTETDWTLPFSTRPATTQTIDPPDTLAA